jgi:hypothetical protein
VLEVGPNLYHASGPHPSDIQVGLVVIALVRDEMWRLPFFLAYHRWLGVRHFIVIDNKSKDGTPDFLGNERDVTCILAPGEYGGRPKGQHIWLRWALSLAPPERWNLLLDADELLVPPALRQDGLKPLLGALNQEGAAIAAASLVDCYPAAFPFPTHFEPVPWQRAPWFDCGPYFQWPAAGSRIRYIHHGVRERVCWPNWWWVRHVKPVVPRPLRPRALHDSPPWVIKMPLLRNVPGLAFHSVHASSGAPRSAYLFPLLHYKFDIDLPAKVELALRERQYARNSHEYEGYARMLAKSGFDLRYEGSRRFEGAQSLVDAELGEFGAGIEDCANLIGPSLSSVVDEVWQHGDLRLQKEAWHRTWAHA